MEEIEFKVVKPSLIERIIGWVWRNDYMKRAERERFYRMAKQTQPRYRRITTKIVIE
jgi:hypothetical protein